MSARHSAIAAERRRRAVEAATSAARDIGLDSTEPRLLKDSNNTVIHLYPEPVVAKVSTSNLDAYRRSSLADELAIGIHLAARRAPIAPPISDRPAGPFSRDGLTITMWELRVHDPAADEDDQRIAHALRSVHAALQDYPRELPPFTVHLDAARAALEDEAATPELARGDRAFLLDVHARLAAEVRARPMRMQPIHGGPHLDGNVLLTDDGPLLIDFEAACVGPIEWDLSYLPEPIARHFPEADRERLRTFRDLTSVCVSTWCWTQPSRAPEVAEAASFHLARLKQLAGSGS